LLATSEGEGFGLPLIEAAKYGLPILARDIAVFREVGQDSVAYFSAHHDWKLKLSIEKWLVSYSQNTHQKSSEMAFSTWSECSKKIKCFLSLSNEILEGENHDD
jgi:glycosyltransferase involved in cell wall biosynthesis